MNMLAIDTSGPSAGVAIIVDGDLRYEATTSNKMTHSANLMPMVEEALLRGGVTLADIGLLAVVVGPGSFTGVRIGVSAAKGMAMAMKTPCVPVNALEALARGLGREDIIVCPIRDARAGQVYGAAFLGAQRLMEDAVLKLTEYVEVIHSLGSRFLFVGDGVAVHQAMLKDLLGESASFAPPHLNALKAGAAAIIAMEQQHLAISADELTPLYLRKPQAEREREKKHG